MTGEQKAALAGPEAEPLHMLAEAIAGPGQTEAGLAALDRTAAALIGHKLFTVLVHDPQRRLVRRFYSNQPEAYPLGGTKTIAPTGWTQQIFERRQPHLAVDRAGIAEVFFDHELIVSLGCESSLCLPVAYDGEGYGAINLLHEAGWYTKRDFPAGRLLAGLAAPLFQQLATRIET